MSRWFLMPDVDAIIERLEATVVRADTVTGEKWSGDMVRWSAAEAAVLAAVDARTAEIVDALRYLRMDPDWRAGLSGQDYVDGHWAAVRKMRAEVARRFPNGGTHE